MNEITAQLLTLSTNAVFAGFVVFLRVGAAMALLPAFGERSVPERVRLLLALAFTLIVAPSVLDHVAPLVSRGFHIGAYLITEVAAGLALGIALRLFVLILQIAGSIAAQSTSLSQIFGGGAVDAQPAIGHLLLVSGLALAVMLGLHLRIVEALVLSYDVLPAGRFPGASDVVDWGIAQVARAFSLAFTLAAPFVIASLLYNVALGVINRAMPQLMVAFVGAPAITAGGLILLAITMPLLLGIWVEALNIYLANPFGAP